MQIQKGSKLITIQDGENLNRYFEEIRKFESITKEEERVLILKIQTNAADMNSALDKLVKANLRFVVSVAKRYQGQGVPLLDLISEGNFGLIDAAKRFDLEKDLKFFSYAVWWIRIRIFTTMDPNKRLISLPANRQMLVQKIRKEIINLEQEIGRYPTMEELEAKLEGQYSREDLLEAIIYGGRVKSIHEAVSGEGDDETTLEDMTKGDLDIDTTDHLESVIKDLDRFLFHLSQYEYDILVLSLGLNEEPHRRHSDISKVLGVKEKDIANIKIRAIKRLRKIKNVNFLKDYI